MKITITTGNYTRNAGHSWRHLHDLRRQEIQDYPQRKPDSVPSGLERFCHKYGKEYCERCQYVECSKRVR